jgi:hypothetical protein
MQPLTHAQAWRDQDDLDALCRDRPLVTREIIGQNAHYGNDLVIKTYAGLGDDEALRIALPHGLELSQDPRDRPYYRTLARLPVIAYYATDGAAVYRDQGLRNLLWPMAAPFVYAGRLVAEDRPGNRRGTIFFPSHSTPAYQPSQDFAELADRLASLPDRYQPVSVCVYFVDYWSGADRPFRERGLRVLSAGHGHDPQFLIRLHHLLGDHEYASANDLGSSSYLAIHAGCNYFHLSDAFATGRAEERDDARGAAALARLERLSGASRAAQRREADRYLGSTHLCEPRELRTLLRRARQLDRWGAAFDRGSRPVPIVVSRPWRPWCAARWLQSRLRPGSVPQTDTPLDEPLGQERDQAGAAEAHSGLR